MEETGWRALLLGSLLVDRTATLFLLLKLVPWGWLLCMSDGEPLLGDKSERFSHAQSREHQASRPVLTPHAPLAAQEV